MKDMYEFLMEYTSYLEDKEDLSVTELCFQCEAKLLILKYELDEQNKRNTLRPV